MTMPPSTPFQRHFSKTTLIVMARARAITAPAAGGAGPEAPPATLRRGKQNRTPTTAPPKPPIRVAGIFIRKDNENYDGQLWHLWYVHRRKPSADANWEVYDRPTRWLLGAMSLCNAAEKRASRILSRDRQGPTPPAALTTLVANINQCGHATEEAIINMLVAKYPALTRSLRTLRITSNEYDERKGLAPLSVLAPQLEEISFRLCGVSSLKELDNRFEYLRKVSLVGCQHLGSINGLKNHAFLEEVYLSDTSISSLEPLISCPRLTKVDCSNCQDIDSLEGLEYHAYLEEVDACVTSIESLEPLLSCPKLTKVFFAACGGLDSLHGLQGHRFLKEVDAAMTKITSVEPLGTCPALTKVDFEGCGVLTSLQGLEGHHHLTEVSAVDTPISSLEPLKSCPNLTKVDLRGCQEVSQNEISQFKQWLQGNQARRAIQVATASAVVVVDLDDNDENTIEEATTFAISAPTAPTAAVTHSQREETTTLGQPTVCVPPPSTRGGKGGPRQKAPAQRRARPDDAVTHDGAVPPTDDVREPPSRHAWRNPNNNNDESTAGILVETTLPPAATLQTPTITAQVLNLVNNGATGVDVGTFFKFLAEQQERSAQLEERLQAERTRLEERHTQQRREEHAHQLEQMKLFLAASGGATAAPVV